MSKKEEKIVYERNILENISKDIRKERIKLFIIEALLLCSLIIWGIIKNITFKAGIGCLVVWFAAVSLTFNSDVLMKIINKIRYFWPIIVIPVLALIVVIIIVSNWPDDVLKKSDIIQFAGEYLSFSGAFGLGYFIFAAEKEKRDKESVDKIDLLFSKIQDAEIDLLSLRNLVGDSSNNKEIKWLINEITYEPRWKELYVEYERIRGKNLDLERKIDLFWKQIYNINCLIKAGKYIEAERMSEYNTEKDCYSFSSYNNLEMVTELLSVQLESGRKKYKNRKTWIEKEETIAQINDLCEKYYSIIENYVYVWFEIVNIGWHIFLNQIVTYAASPRAS